MSRCRKIIRSLPASPYALSKLAQELVGVENTGGPSVLVARAFNHFGPRQDPFFAASGFARRIADIEAGRWTPEIQVGNLEARRDLTDVRDTVRAYRAIVERGRPGRAYNVCSGRAVAIARCARHAARARTRADPHRGRSRTVSVRTINPWSSAIRPAFGRSLAGRRRSPSNARWTTSWNTGAPRPLKAESARAESRCDRARPAPPRRNCRSNGYEALAPRRSAGRRRHGCRPAAPVDRT